MVRTSLNPTLQLAAEKALRDGLMGYDRKLGGWRGPVSHLDAPRPRCARDWASQLGAAPRPPGMLPDWGLGVVIETTDGEAKDRLAGSAAGAARAPPQPRTGALLLSDLGWARPVHDGRLGAAPRRIADVVHPGDLVMIESRPDRRRRPAPQRARRPPPPRPADRVQLRQIPQVQGALVSLDPTTGRVLAMVGGWSFERASSTA